MRTVSSSAAEPEQSRRFIRSSAALRDTSRKLWGNGVCAVHACASWCVRDWDDEREGVYRDVSSLAPRLRTRTSVEMRGIVPFLLIVPLGSPIELSNALAGLAAVGAADALRLWPKAVYGRFVDRASVPMVPTLLTVELAEVFRDDVVDPAREEVEDEKDGFRTPFCTVCLTVLLTGRELGGAGSFF